MPNKETPKEKPGRGWAWKFTNGTISNLVRPTIDELKYASCSHICETAKPVRVYITTKKPE